MRGELAAGSPQGYHSPMRAITATILLLLQLRPIMGVALCQVFSGGDGERMELGCPMSEAQAVPGTLSEDGSVSDPATSGPGTGPALVVSADVHGCLLAEFCLTSPPALRSVQLSLVSPLPYSRLTIRPAADAHTALNRTPPVPPPKL